MRAVLALVAITFPSVAALAQSWAQVTPNPPTPAPIARNHGAMAYDAARGLTMLFGGYNGTATPLSDFWAFNGTSWQQLGGTVPAARWGHGMVYDTRRQRLVLFGGFQPSPGNPIPDAIGLNDTWEYDGFGWTQRTTTTQPSPRGCFGMTYDPIRQRTVLFGGAGPNTTYLQDTWEWNGTTWISVNAPAQPSIRRGPAMAYDMERAEVVLFGGGALGTQFGDTWVYNGTTWTQRAPTTSPPARWESTLAFDPLCGEALLIGGTTFTYQTIFADSWRWNGATWTQVTGNQPSARHGGAAAFDLQAGQSLLLGGRDSAGFRSDLWGWSGGCNRTMSTITPAVAGQTAQYRYNYPSTATNNVFLELWTRRNPNAFVLPIPGFVSVGLMRVDVFYVLLQGGGVLGASGTQSTATLAIPNTAAVLGFTYDLQDLDIDLSSNFLYWSSNEIEATVVPGSPIASFTAAPTSGAAPLAVQFTNTSASSTSWQWDFQNDGVVDSTQQNPSFTYTAPGTYSVRLVATGPNGSNTVTQNGLITVLTPASFTATPTSGNAPLTVQFTDTTPFAVTSWQWDFQNDGVIDSTVQNPTFTYTANGSYSVRLVVGTASGPLAVVRIGLIRVWLLNPALNMAAIAPGTFQMGSPVTPLNVAPYFNQSQAQPVHQVTISQPFWMGRNEVTQAQYQAVMGNNPSHHQGASWPNAANRPVEQVSWNAAVAYCDALTVQEAAASRLPPGYEYRLPTEAEWEYCCRAGTTTEFHYGATLACGQANFSASNHTGSICSNQLWVQTVVVGSYVANAWGLYDMHGNVVEWCLDGWDGSNNYPAGPVTDPYVLGSSGPYRVLRGGDFLVNSSYCRSASRTGVDPTNVSRSAGFRVVCTPVLP
ncbi:MAG: SUMF1/EgtB/PvdO family nonheme iron enzyme [Planctomycetes bacterium]|nr:SUMF1/EgtB/PvdO family nonheme iron enzyme [Planctomycetota bacterium]